MNKLFIIILVIFLAGCSPPSNKNPHIIIYTTLGEIEVELFPQQAPKTVTAFLSFVDSGYFNNSSFYRVVLAEGLSTSLNVGLIQGGIWQTKDQQSPAMPGIEHESTNQTGLSHTTGTISLARTAPGTANTEFFICIGDQSQFDYGNTNPADEQGFAAFGRVSKGMSIVRTIQVQTKQGESFVPKINIKKIERL